MTIKLCLFSATRLETQQRVASLTCLEPSWVSSKCLSVYVQQQTSILAYQDAGAQTLFISALLAMSAGYSSSAVPVSSFLCPQWVTTTWWSLWRTRTTLWFWMLCKDSGTALSFCCRLSRCCFRSLVPVRPPPYVCEVFSVVQVMVDLKVEFEGTGLVVSWRCLKTLSLFGTEEEIQRMCIFENQFSILNLTFKDLQDLLRLLQPWIMFMWSEIH